MSLKLSAYLPSLEDHEELPSPLIDGDAVPAVVAPIAEINETPVLPGDDVGPLPLIEDVVELPPHLDPTPMAPLEGEVIQEEIIAENLDTQAGQLLGAQIAMEGYQKLLRNSGKNVTRQSAAFMAVGMRRATRLVPGVSLGLEDESSGTQVMAMQQAKVDEKGLGDKLKEGAARLVEWLKKQFEKLRTLYNKLKGIFSKRKEQIVYLLAFSDAVASGNPGKLKSLPAPDGLQVAKITDIPKEKKSTGGNSGTIQLNAGESTLFVNGGKLDISSTTIDKLLAEQKTYIQALIDYTSKSVTIGKEFSKDSNVENAIGQLEEAAKATVGAAPVKISIGDTSSYDRNDEGIVTLDLGGADATEVSMPSIQDINAFLKKMQSVLETQESVDALIGRYLDEGLKGAETIDGRTARLGEDKSRELALAMMKFNNRPGFSAAGNIEELSKIISIYTKNAVTMADRLLTLLAGGGTISQEDFERLPSRGLAVIPQVAGPGRIQRGVAMARAAWEKLKAWFRAKWDQFTAWAKGLWNRLFGIDQQTDVLLLTNDAIPDEGQPGPAKPVPQLPNGTRLKSVQAARAIAGPSDSGIPEPTMTPEINQLPVNDAPVASVPKGMVFVPELKELMLNGQLALDPVWEEEMTNWLLRHYIPTQEKIVRDLTSWAGTAGADMDVGIMGYQEIVDRATPQLFQGMPTNAPGQRTIQPGSGTKIQIRQEGQMDDAQPVKIAKKRQIDQALSRQKKLLKALEGIEKSRLVTERQRNQLNSILDKRVAEGLEERLATGFYNYLEGSVIQTSAVTVAGVIARICAARVAVCDAMIAARAQR